MTVSAAATNTWAHSIPCTHPYLRHDRIVRAARRRQERLCHHIALTQSQLLSRHRLLHAACEQFQVRDKRCGCHLSTWVMLMPMVKLAMTVKVDR